MVQTAETFENAPSSRVGATVFNRLFNSFCG